jgi:hypothetical protein
MICNECAQEQECRPYGKNAAMICFDCAMKDEAETEKNYLMQLLAAEKESNVIIIGEETGPRPLR